MKVEEGTQSGQGAHVEPEPWLPSSGDSPEEEAGRSPATGDLPAVAPAADLARSRLGKGWMALCFGVTFLAYAALIPRTLLYSSPPTGDQPYYLMVTISLVQDHDIDLANNFATWDETKFYTLAPHPPGFVGMQAPFPLPPHPAQGLIRPKTEAYDFHLPGLPLLLVPAWVIGSWFQLWWPATIVFMCLLGALVALNVFLLAHEMTGKL